LIVSWQSDLENTKESILPVCDKPYHNIKDYMPLVERLENLWNYPLYNSIIIAANMLRFVIPNFVLFVLRENKDFVTV